jgi:hypothetical protein
MNGKKLMLFGAALILLPPAILFSIFGNQEITGPVTALLPITPLFILGGVALFVIGFMHKNPNAPDVIIHKLHLNNPIMNAFVKRTNSWISWFALVILWLPTTWSQWHNPSFFDDKKFGVMFWLLPVSILIGLILGRLIWKAPWHVILIGDTDLKPRDERETAILHKSAQYTLALSVLLSAGLVELLLVAPPTSQIALIDAFIIFWFLLRGMYGFIAWKLGLR